MVRLAIYVLLGISLCCQFDMSSGRTRKEQQNPSYDRYNFFDSELFEILNRNEDQNILISPLSIKITLGMMMEGADGASAKEIRSALRLQNDENLARKEFNKWMNSLREKSPSTVLEIANRLFVSHKNPIKPTYRHTLEQDYLSDVTKVKFEEPKETAQLINSWISNQTSGLIPSLVDEAQLSDKTKMLLTSSVYFKGKWSNPFPPERTAVKCFYQNGDECKRTSMMMDSGTFNYAYIAKLDAQAIDLPYQDEKFSMLVLLPSKRHGVKQLSRDLLHVTMEDILSQMKQHDVYVQLPRFTADYHKDIVDTLKLLQISQVFGPKANLSRILQQQNESIFVSNVFHSAKIIVNEEGSEAAAATGALFVPLMGNSRTVLNVDHPFLFFIRDTTTGTILFAGKISQPEEVIEDKVNVLQPANEPAAAAAAANPALQHPSQQIFYQEIFTPSPPVNNAVQKESPYVNRKPGRLPPPPRPTGLPNGFLPQSVGSNSNLKDKSSSETGRKPVSTEPPSLFRPTTPKPTPTTPSPTKRNVRNQQKYRYTPIRRILVPENLAYQEDMVQSYYKKMAFYNRYRVDAETEKNRKIIRIENSYRDDSPYKNKYDAGVDRISFLN